jgi:hypothetical protein
MPRIQNHRLNAPPRGGNIAHAGNREPRFSSNQPEEFEMNTFKSMLANAEDVLSATAQRYGGAYMAQARRRLTNSKSSADRRAMYLL